MPIIYGGIYTHFRRVLSALLTFLDATRIDPCIFNLIFESLLAGLSDLLVAGFRSCWQPIALDFFKRDLLVAPSVGENGVGWCFGFVELFQSERPCI